MYVPEEIPSGVDVNALSAFIGRELNRISAAMQADTISVTVLHGAPEKPFEMQIAGADGTDWNPGAGRGIYAYISGAWVKL